MNMDMSRCKLERYERQDGSIYPDMYLRSISWHIIKFEVFAYDKLEQGGIDPEKKIKLFSDLLDFIDN